MPFGADTPTPEFVGNSRVRGARSPPGTPRDPTTPSRAHLGPAAGHTDPPADFARAKWRSVPPAGLLHGKAEKRRPADFTRAKSESPVPGWTFPEQSPKVCRPVTFPEQSGKVCPLGLHQSKVRKRKPGGGCARRAKKTRFSENFFSPPTRIYKRKRGLLLRKKKR